MENLPAAKSAFERPISDVTLGELLLTPFHPVEILRPLGPYGRMLDLKPAIPKAPDPEFLVRLLSDHASHQACIRHEAGSQYKNLENLIRARHKVSSTTKLLMARTLGISLDDLQKLEGSAPDGPLIPEILATFQIVEGIPMRVMSGVLNREVPCRCCGANLLDDVDAWWSRHAPGMRRAEYQFAERLLNAIVGAGLIERFVALFQERAELPLDRLERLADPSRHPVGNWLAEAQVAISCDSLASLAATMQLRSDGGDTFSYGRLKKWSAGQNVMPLEAGEAISKACGQPKSGMRRFVSSRTIALVTDFVTASWLGPEHVEKEVAREVVHARLAWLGGNLQLAMAAIVGKVPLLTKPSRAPDSHSV